MPKIELAYASADNHCLVCLQLPAQISVKAVLLQSMQAGILPQIDFSVIKVGVFSKPVALDYLLNDGDRLEIYSPLLIDPKTRRKKLSANKNRRS